MMFVLSHWVTLLPNKKVSLIDKFPYLDKNYVADFANSLLCSFDSCTKHTLCNDIIIQITYLYHAQTIQRLIHGKVLIAVDAARYKKEEHGKPVLRYRTSQTIISSHIITRKDNFLRKSVP